MAIESDENKPSEEEGVSPAGMVEAVTQDVELIVDKVMDTAGDAVVVIQEKLGMRTAPRAKKPAKPKAKAKAPAIKAKAPAVKAKVPAPKAKAPAPKMKARPVAKATAAKFVKAKVSKAMKAKPSKVAKSVKPAAKPAPSKGKKAKGRR